MAGTGLPIPKYGDNNVQPINVIDGDKLSTARSWASIAADGEKIAKEGMNTLKMEAHQQQLGWYAESDTTVTNDRHVMRDKFADDPEGFKNAWQAYSDGKKSEAPAWAIPHLTASLGSNGNSAYAGILGEKRSRDQGLAAERINTFIKQADSEVIAAAMAGNMRGPNGIAAVEKFRAANASAVNAGLMSQEKADFNLDDLSSRAFGEVAGKEGVDIYRSSGYEAAIEHLRKNILENEDLKLSPAARRRAFEQGRKAISLEKQIDSQGRVGVVQESRDLLARITSGQPYDNSELADTAGAALRVGAVAQHRQLIVEHEVRQATAGLGIRELADATLTRRTATAIGTPEQSGAIAAAAGRLGVSPRDLAAAISYETGGTFDPNKVGGKGNNYLGLIQFGPEERAQYGVRKGMSFEQQMVAVEGFLRDRGVKPGMGISDIYRTINGGNPNVSLNASDGNGTIAQHIQRIQAGHYPNADRFLGGTALPVDAADNYVGEITKRVQQSLVSQARKSWPDLQRQIAAGNMPDVEDVDAVRVAAILSGDGKWMKQVEEVAAASRIGTAMADRPMLERQALMDRAQAELSDATVQSLRKQFDRQNKMIKDDPISYAIENGIKPPTEVDPSNSAAFRDSLKQRAIITQGVANDQGVTVGSALRAPEVEGVKAALEKASPDNKLRIFTDMAASLPEPVYRATMDAIGNDTLTQFVGTVARDRPDLAREILHGAEIMNIDKTGNKASLVRPAFQEKIGRDLYPSAADQNNVTQAAMALYTARRGSAGALYDPTDTSGIEKAIEDVTGKIVKRGGVKVAIPPGMTAGAFDTVMSRLTPESLGQFGGAFDRSGKPFDPKFLGDRAVLKQMGPGNPNYLVGLPDATARDGIAPVLTNEGMPLVIDIKQLAVGQPAATLTPFQLGVTRARTGQVERLQSARRQSLEAP